MIYSGSAVVPFARYFGIEPESVLIAFDEVAFAVGVTKLKLGGGANGHNGVKDVIQAFGGKQDFGRLRIGVGHPGQAAQLVPFLTRSPMPENDRIDASNSSYLDNETLDWLLDGDWQRAMTKFHSKSIAADEMP